MKLNEQIREHRKKIGLTQEQVAGYLGVSAPAVNKWESGATYPDITLLSPLARLLKIDLNTLFTFHEDLSREEIAGFCNEVQQIAVTDGFKAGYAHALDKLQEYPNCDLLRYSLALLLEGCLSFSALSADERETYACKFMEWYQQAARARRKKHGKPPSASWSISISTADKQIRRQIWSSSFPIKKRLISRC